MLEEVAKYIAKFLKKHGGMSNGYETFVEWYGEEYFDDVIKIFSN